MTTLFFLTSILYAWLAFNLFYPNYTNRHWSVVSFLTGWLTGELAFHHIAWQLFLTLFFVITGAVDGLLGALGLLICVCSWSTLAYHYAIGNRAKIEVELALVEGLGKDYREQIPDNLKNLFPTSLDLSRLFKPFPLDDPKVELIRDIPYGAMNLDIYRVAGFENCPVLLQIHGGGWTEKLGSKNKQAKPLMNHMALRGWICVSIDYRLSPTATFPEHIIDCKQALVWVKENINKYGGNRNFIVITGGSAGGHLGSLLALSVNDPDFQPGFEDRDTTVQGCVSFYGIYDFTNEFGLQKNDGLEKMLETSVVKSTKTDNILAWQKISPLHRVHPEAPPFLIIHGDTDSVASVDEARLFADKLLASSNNPVVYAEIVGGQHAFDMFPSLRSEHVKNGVERFLAYLYSQYLESQGK